MPARALEVLPSAVRTVTGSLTLALARQDGVAVEAARFFMDITAASGTTPTLDVDVVELLPGGRERVAGSFAQQVAAGVALLQIAAADLPMAANLRIDFTIGGTSPSFTFSIDALVVD